MDTLIEALPVYFPDPAASPDYSNILQTMLVATVCGLVVYLVYRLFNRSVVYNANFGLLIFMVTLVTAFIIITIGVNIVLSLGMLGALSIVRFRAAVKDPLDVGFLFWGVAAGLTAGANLHMLAFTGTGFIAVAYIIISYLRMERRSFLLILRYTRQDEAAIEALLSSVRYKLRNKQHNPDWIELVAEVKVKNNYLEHLKPVLESPLAISASLTEYSGEFV